MGHWEEARAHAGRGQDLEVVGPNERRLEAESVWAGPGLPSQRRGTANRTANSVERRRGHCKGETGEGDRGEHMSYLGMSGRQAPGHQPTVSSHTITFSGKVTMVRLRL